MAGGLLGAGLAFWELVSRPVVLLRSVWGPFKVVPSESAWVSLGRGRCWAKVGPVQARVPVAMAAARIRFVLRMMSPWFWVILFVDETVVIPLGRGMARVVPMEMNSLLFSSKWEGSGLGRG